MTICDHMKKRAAFKAAKYALVEFAHRDSVDLVIERFHKNPGQLTPSGPLLQVARAGLSHSGVKAQKSDDFVMI